MSNDLTPFPSPEIKDAVQDMRELLSGVPAWGWRHQEHRTSVDAATHE